MNTEITTMTNEDVEDHFQNELDCGTITLYDLLKEAVQLGRSLDVHMQYNRLTEDDILRIMLKEHGY